MPQGRAETKGTSTAKLCVKEERNESCNQKQTMKTPAKKRRGLRREAGGDPQVESSEVKCRGQ